jgi:glycosyltransferase involved in cell wall biosynthesis
MTPPRILMIPTHPGVQYHFCRVGPPIHFLGHWDQFQYWRPQPENVHNLLPTFQDEHLNYGPDDYARLLDGYDLAHDFDLAWLMFNWQFKLFRNRRAIKKLYRVSKVAELERDEWSELLSRDDFTVVSFYPNTVEWVRDHYGIDIPYIPLGLDPDAYHGWTGEERTILSIIHSYQERGWHYREYREATADLPTLHIDHLDPTQPVRRYDDLQQALRRSRLYLHDGEQEYTITLIEAMMTGLPIVSFELPGIRRYVVDGVNGFVGRSAAEIRDRCRLLLDDAELARRMGAAGRQMALADYHEARWRRDWILAIDRFLAR